MSKRKVLLTRRSEKALPGNGVTIKVSTSLYSAAKEGAQRSHRSVPKQVEYWTDLGRVLDDAGVSKNDLMQAANTMRLRLRNAPSRATVLLQDLVTVFEAPRRDAEAEFAGLVETGKGPVYGTSPEFPGKIVQRLQDGTERAGSFQDGKFVPEQLIEAEQRYARAGR